MGLSYYFAFSAPASVSAEDLMAFLRNVEQEAKRLRFDLTAVMRVAFDSAERREFAKRLTKGMTLEDERLKGVAVPADPEVWRHDPHEGVCRLMPTAGVILVVTDDSGCETVFGFFKYPEVVRDIHGRTLAETGLFGRWSFSGFVDSPDRRFRELVGLFVKAGYVAREKDEFLNESCRPPG